MKKSLSFAALSLMAILPTCAIAAAPDALSFRELEFQQSRDPLLPSNQSSDIVEHTSTARLAPASTALNEAIPVGTSRAHAEAILHQAGATCRADAASSEHCSYFDVKMRDPYVDAVRWNVRLDLADDRVSGMSVDRTWRRD